MPPKYPVFEQIERLYRNAFQQLGYHFTLVSLPRTREVAEVLNSRLDGSCARPDVAPFSNSDQVIRLEAPVARAIPQLLTHFESLSDINTSYREAKLAYVRGSQWANQDFSLLGQRESIGVTTVDLGIKMLAAKRIGFFVDNGAMQDMILESMDIETPLYRHALGEPYYLYPFISRDHQELVEPLEKSLTQAMQETAGTVLLGSD